MIKNKTRAWPYLYLFFIVFIWQSSHSLNAQETSDWSTPLQKAHKLLTNKEYLTSLQEFKNHAESGNGLAQFNVALFYDFGWGVIEHRDTACVWYQKAALSNMPGAMQQLGQCYQQGTGLEKDTNQALLWYTKAYEQGVHGAYCEAGLLLLTDKSISKNIEMGIQLCAKGAELGAINAQQKLAKWFFYGEYLAQDYQQAYKWLTYVASIKSPESAYLLAQYFDRGIGMEIDTKQALKWYEMAASQGYAAAYLPTAALYWHEFSLNDDAAYLAKTYLWTKASCHVNDNGSVSNKLLLTQVMKVMPEDWQTKLNLQVEAHLKTFNNLSQSTDC